MPSLLAPCFVLTFYFGSKNPAAYFYIFQQSQRSCLVPLMLISFSTHFSSVFIENVCLHMLDLVDLPLLKSTIP